jgi:putative ABC transport system permease protein
VAVIIVIAVLSVLNTLIRIIQERTREIGTLRSIGFRNAQVKTIFILEAFFLAVLGNAAGWVMAYAISKLINSAEVLYKVGVLAEPVPFKVWPTLHQSIQSSIILILLSVLAAVFPTAWATRKKITECLTST